MDSSLNNRPYVHFETFFAWHASPFLETLVSIFEIRGCFTMTLVVMGVALRLEKQVSLNCEQEERQSHARRDHYHR